MAYSTAADLLLGDMVLGTLDTSKYIDDAARDMNAKLGFIYSLPLHPESAVNPDESSWQELPLHERLLLQQINNRLASGKLILAMAVGQEGSALHAYGLHLIRTAEADLMLLANGEAHLTAVRLDGTTADPTPGGTRTPSIHNYDEESLLLGFENTVHRNEYWWSKPGTIP